MSIVNYVSGIDPSKESLKFIDKRLSYDNYRGQVSSQHNRYDLEELHITLSILRKYAPCGELMRIRDTDLSKRPENIAEEQLYAYFCNDVRKAVGKGTQDSIRKNLLVDWHRMGFVKRFNKDKEEILPYVQSHIRYICLSPLGEMFVNESDPVERAYLFSKGINEIHKGFVEATLQLLDILDNHRISFGEFMYFVTAIDADNYGITVEKCAELITDFRTLPASSKKSVDAHLKRKLVPENYEGNKRVSRDYHNWVNKNEQMWHLFKWVVFFIVDEGMNTLELYTYESSQVKEEFSRSKMKRSPVTRAQYFINHNVSKKLGYELDHIIPLFAARSLAEFKFLDEWKNLLYLNAYQHAIKTQSGSEFQTLKTTQDLNVLTLQNFNGETLELINGESVLYNPDLIERLIEYNKVGLNRVYN